MIFIFYANTLFKNHHVCFAKYEKRSNEFSVSFDALLVGQSSFDGLVGIFLKHGFVEIC
jgi:hypothetical protein